MSPTKPSSPIQRLQRSVGQAASAIPRRNKAMATTTMTTTTTGTTKKTTTASRKPPSGSHAAVGAKTKSASGPNDSIFHDGTATSRPAKLVSYFSNAAYGGDNKENIPLSGAIHSRGSAARVPRTSPTKGKTGISKASKLSPSSVDRAALARRPLRELSEDEIFERDEAVLGDLRRRRSGEHSGTYIEFESHTAHVLPPKATRGSSVASTASTAPPDVDCDAAKVRVLHRSDSAESLRLKVEAIMAAATAAAAATASSKTTTKRLPGLREKLQTPIKVRHPALRSGNDEESFVFSGTTTPSLGSPERAAPLLTSPAKMSPVLARQTASPIAKSPAGARPLRMGLASRSANTILKEARQASQEKGAKKVIISANNSDTLGGKRKAVARKAANNSLRRAAATSSTVKTGLEAIRRMR